MNIYDFDHEWRFTERGLCLYRGEVLVGELVRLQCGPWALFSSNGDVPRCLGTCEARVKNLVHWAEIQLLQDGVMPEDAKIDRFALPVDN